MTEETVYIGVEMAAGKRPVTVAVLNKFLDVLSLEEIAPDDVIEKVSGYGQVICAINGPAAPNKGLLADPDYRSKVGLEPDQKNYRTYRVCEYEIRRRGIGIYNTNLEPDRVTKWMKTSWDLFDKLHEVGFVDYPDKEGERQLLEVHPHSAFTVMMGHRPYTSGGFEGQLQRQLLLFENGIEVPDAMSVIHEWTRHRVLTGSLNLDEVLSPEELDALIAAYTAFLAAKEPEKVVLVGDANEGQIALPTDDLKDSYE